MTTPSETVALRLRLPKALHATMVALANRENRSLNSEIVVALERHTILEPRRGKK